MIPKWRKEEDATKKTPRILFSFSRWEIFLQNVGCSIEGMNCEKFLSGENIRGRGGLSREEAFLFSSLIYFVLWGYLSPSKGARATHESVSSKRRRIKFFVVSRFFSLSLRSLSNFDNREFMIRGMNDRGGGKFRCSFVRQVISRDVG